MSGRVSLGLELVRAVSINLPNNREINETWGSVQIWNWAGVSAGSMIVGAGFCGLLFEELEGVCNA